MPHIYTHIDVCVCVCLSLSFSLSSGSPHDDAWRWWQMQAPPGPSRLLQMTMLCPVYLPLHSHFPALFPRGRWRVARKRNKRGKALNRFSFFLSFFFFLTKDLTSSLFYPVLLNQYIFQILFLPPPPTLRRGRTVWRYHCSCAATIPEANCGSIWRSIGLVRTSQRL